MFDGSVEPSGEVGRPGGPIAAEIVGHTIHLMKDDWKVQLLNTGQNGRKARVEYVVVPFDGVGQMDGPYAGLAGHAVQLLVGEFGVADRQLDADDKAIGIFLVDLDAGVIDDLSEMRTLCSGSSLPRHSARQSQAMHEIAMVVHPQ